MYYFLQQQYQLQIYCFLLFDETVLPICISPIVLTIWTLFLVRVRPRWSSSWRVHTRAGASVIELLPIEGVTLSRPSAGSSDFSWASISLKLSSELQWYDKSAVLIIKLSDTSQRSSSMLFSHRLDNTVSLLIDFLLSYSYTDLLFFILLAVVSNDSYESIVRSWYDSIVH
jgi:hypothetical protein